jgi:hypothetical protein
MKYLPNYAEVVVSLGYHCFSVGFYEYPLTNNREGVLCKKHPNPKGPGINFRFPLVAG